MANHSGLIRFICTANAWNSAVRSKSSSLRGAPWSFGTSCGDILDVRRWDRAAGVVHQDVDAAVGVDDPLDEGVDRAVIALVADHLGERSRPLGFVSVPGSASSAEREQPMTVAPARSSSCAMPTPTPRLVPVTIATLPSNVTMAKQLHV